MKLRECPFCGGEATLWKHCAVDRSWHIFCGCGGRVGYFETRGEAIDAWNRRHKEEKEIADAMERFDYAHKFRVGDDLTERMVDDGK